MISMPVYNDNTGMQEVNKKTNGPLVDSEPFLRDKYSAFDLKHAV